MDDRTVRPSDRMVPPGHVAGPDDRTVRPSDRMARPEAWPGQVAGPDDRTVRPSDRLVPPGQVVPPDDPTRPAEDRTRRARTGSSSGEWGPARRFQVGAQVGEFVLERKLGQGGMGAVFVARHAQTEQRVAVKVLLVAQDDLRDDELERFRREGEAQAAVGSHPNVLRVITFGAHLGYPYLVTELAPGGDLKSRLQGGPMEPRAAAELVRALASGLAHVHAKGVLHRDLKPANVVFGEGDVPKLMDFGLARLAGARKLTQTGAMMGTPAYMAPEQAAGERIDERADVYGLGAVLFHCLVGRPPFVGGSDFAIVKQVLTAAVEAPRALRPDVPADLDAIVLRALARAPDDRYPSAAAFGEDLARFLAGARPEAARRGRRSRAPAALGALALVAVASAGALLVRARASAESAPGPAVAVATTGPRRVDSEAAFLDVTDGELGAWRLAAPGTTAYTVRARARGAVRLRVTPYVVKATHVVPRVGEPTEREVPEGDEVELSIPVSAGWQRLELVGADPRAPLARLELIVLPDALSLAPDHGPHAVVGREGSVLLLVPPGEFDYSGEPDAILVPGRVAKRHPPRRRELFAPFFLGRSEVSWRQMERYYRDETGEALERRPYEFEGRWFDPPDDHPAVRVQAWRAEAYCLTYGLRLPTAYEWERAAEGVVAGNLNGDADGHAFTAPVDEVLSLPGAVGRWGHLHLIGNVWEFVQLPPGAERAPNYGGAWKTAWRWRANDSLELAGEHLGFRVALGVEEEPPAPSYPTPF